MNYCEKCSVELSLHVQSEGLYTLTVFLCIIILTYLVDIGIPIPASLLKSDRIRPVSEDKGGSNILLCKLGPYQELQLTAWAVKVFFFPSYTFHALLMVFPGHRKRTCKMESYVYSCFFI